MMAIDNISKKKKKDKKKQKVPLRNMGLVGGPAPFFKVPKTQQFKWFTKKKLLDFITHNILFHFDPRVKDNLWSKNDWLSL